MPYAPCGTSLATKGVLSKSSAFLGGGGGPPMTKEVGQVKPYITIKRVDVVETNKLEELSKQIIIKLINN